MNADEVMDQRDQDRELARLRQINAEMLEVLGALARGIKTLQEAHFANDKRQVFDILGRLPLDTARAIIAKAGG